MSNEIKIFLNGIANSLKIDGYYHVVTSPRKMGEITTKINYKRSKSHKRIKKVVDERITEITD